MILTVTPNPMLDKTLWVPRFAPGITHRATRSLTIGSGKGINVSRALLHLGEQTLATGFLGGYTGEQIRLLLDSEKLPHDFVETAGLTRVGITVFDEEHGNYTAVFEPGPQLHPNEVERLEGKVRGLLPRCQALTLCGSMPSPGFDDLYFRLTQLAKAQQVPVFLDSYNEPFRQCLAACPNFLKPNREEILQTFGIDIRDPQGMAVMLRKLVQTGAQWIFLTDGDRKVGVYAHDNYYLAAPPKINVVNTLGSGDAMVAAFLFGWLRRMTTEDLIRFTIAAGAVNAEEFMPGFADRNRMEEMAKRVIIEPFLL
ncbi:MAG: 1-phosphofructokinase family hexose kinase [candidate division KSB1 bacterium]|nr:1-phosphofructokinase family hexose kinase [candidate division KSB1 bacterium]MDZ7301059.1 1-phosphofructokinase family hexose kinase [candidate division KSB1 bacterium]MDZ7312117.1 1-phosphofructokinase family hexose kinase [candidate division KSB1 bacterium]